MGLTPTSLRPKLQLSGDRSHSQLLTRTCPDSPDAEKEVVKCNVAAGGGRTERGQRANLRAASPEGRGMGMQTARFQTQTFPGCSTESHQKTPKLSMLNGICTPMTLRACTGFETPTWVLLVLCSPSSITQDYPCLVAAHISQGSHAAST